MPTWGARPLPRDRRDRGGALAERRRLRLDGRQVAYARLVTDRATFAWLCDVYVDPGYRGRGLGTRLVESVVARLEPMQLRRTMLATQDAHDIYTRFGFTPLTHPERMMVREAPPPAPSYLDQRRRRRWLRCEGARRRRWLRCEGAPAPEPRNPVTEGTWSRRVSRLVAGAPRTSTTGSAAG